MSGKELMEELEWAIEQNGGDDVEVRIAQQPKWPFEYSLDSAALVNRAEGGSFRTPTGNRCAGAGEPIVYLKEGAQLGYLPEKVGETLGWN